MIFLNSRAKFIYGAKNGNCVEMNSLIYEDGGWTKTKPNATLSSSRGNHTLMRDAGNGTLIPVQKFYTIEKNQVTS